MIFSRIVYSAILVGLVTGLLLSCLQITSLDPIIFAAESYQQGTVDAHADHDHDHGEHEWMPADGLERTAYTLLANLLVSTGFAAVMLALMNLYRLSRGRGITWSQGSLWGLAGYAAVFLAPALGLPPEIPGAAAAALEHRQIWWLLTALSASIGIALLVLAPLRYKAPGLLFLVIPYVVGAPTVEGPVFQHHDVEVVQELVRLHQQFIVASGITNLVFWLSLGLACRYSFTRWLMASTAGDS